jgi:hypothetical protein
VRVRVALATLSVLVLVLTFVAALSGRAEGEAPGAPRSGQILAEPNPPHRVFAAPLDAATPDPAPVPRKTPHPRVTPNLTRSSGAHPVGTLNLPRSVRSSNAAFLACVVRHESHGSYTAENPTSTASGKYQFIDASWRAYSKMAGHPGWSHAASAPPAVQDAVALWLVNKGWRYPWKGDHC